MTQAFKVVQSGLPSNPALAIVGDVATGLTATGSTQATALTLGATKNFVSTTAASTGVMIPAMSAGDSVYVYNGGASTLTVYPQVGSNLNNLAANAGFSVATLKGVYVEASSALQASTILSA